MTLSGAPLRPPGNRCSKRRATFEALIANILAISLVGDFSHDTNGVAWIGSMKILSARTLNEVNL